MFSFAVLATYLVVLYIRPMDWHTLPVYGLQIMGLGLMDFITILALAAWAGKRAAQGGRLMRSATDWMVLGLFLAALMSHVAHTFLGMFITTFTDFGKVILLYFIVVNILDARWKVKAFAVLLVLVTAFMAVHGVLQIHRGYGFDGQLPMIQGVDTVRIKAFGIFEDPNDLGLTLVVAMPFLLMTVTARRGVFTRIGAMGLLGLLGYALYLTNSRGAFVAVVVTGFVFFYRRFGRVLGVALGTLLVLGVMVYAPSRVQSMGGDTSGSGRREVWTEGLKMFKSNPVFGVGWGRFGEHASAGKTAHNSLVLAFAEMGLVGLFFYVGMFYVTMRDLHRIDKLEPPEDADDEETDVLRSDQALVRALYASLWGFTAAAFFLSRTYNQVPYVLIGMSAAFASIVRAETAPEPAEDEEPQPERLLYDFYVTDTGRVAALSLATIPTIYVLCRLMWR